VSIGSPTKETTVAKGTIEKIVVTIGNQSNSALHAFQFQVAHPSPLTQPLAKQGAAPQESQPGGALKAPIGRMQEYHVLARVSATVGLCPQVDSNCTNNQTFRAIQVPLGGTPTCTRLQ
jgi:hypothetical protein